MILTGLILLVLGLMSGVDLITVIALLLIITGGVLALVGLSGRQVGGRRYWY